MEDLSKKVLLAGSGEHRLNPDEQRRYLGTFEERVVLLINLDDARSETVQQHFSEMLSQLKSLPCSLYLKISSELPLSTQMTYMKIAESLNIKTTIIRESKGVSPYGLLIHSDQVVDIKEKDIRMQFPGYFITSQHKNEKKSFWAKLFNK